MMLGWPEVYSWLQFSSEINSFALSLRKVVQKSTSAEQAASRTLTMLGSSLVASNQDLEV
jgi:hypothetical protein